ncbi:MAG: caspase family protein [Gemmatimonadaceae bacterium]|nr:caspase family protein [Gemmatimonadaceae bacterium]
MLTGLRDLRRLGGVLMIGASAVMATEAKAQRTHVLYAGGLSGAPQFKTQFTEAATALRDVARTRWAVADSSLIILTEDSTAAGTRSTRENIAAAFLRLSRRVQPGDVLLVMLVGHGSGEGAGSKVNLPGPDATAAEYAAWLQPFEQQQVVFVNAATGSGDFVPVLSKPGRVVITATKSALEKNESEFLKFFVQGIKGSEADGDKDGRLSVLEVFRYARAEVARSYERSKRLLTEHALVSDSSVAARITFGQRATSNDPRIAALIAERQALESQVAALRGKKDSMTAAAYEAELERLLLAIAEKTAAIKAAGGDK